MVQYIVDFINVFQGLRKTVVMLAVLIVTAVFRVKGYLGPDNMEGILKATVVSFFASNSIEHYTAMVKERLLANGKKEEVTEIDSKTIEEG
jgi:hypothetical protein